MRLKRKTKKGSVLIETLIAMALLAIVLTSIIQSLLTSLNASRIIRDSFEASVLLENILFEIKNDEKGEQYARAHEGKLSGPFLAPNDYSYQVSSQVIGSTQKAWGQVTVYQNFKVRINWRDGRDFLTNDSVCRTRVQTS